MIEEADSIQSSSMTPNEAGQQQPEGQHRPKDSLRTLPEDHSQPAYSDLALKPPEVVHLVGGVGGREATQSETDDSSTSMTVPSTLPPRSRQSISSVSIGELLSYLEDRHRV